MLKFLLIICIICRLTSAGFHQLVTSPPDSLHGHHSVSKNNGEFRQLNTKYVNTLQGDSVVNNISYANSKRNKRFVGILFDSVGMVTDIISIAQEAEANAMMEENFRDMLSSLDRNFDAINNVQDTMDLMMQKSMDAFGTLQQRFDQNTDEIIAEIDIVGKKVDRNSGYLLEILRTASMTYTAIERNRLEMLKEFNNALSYARNTAVKPKLTKMNNFVTYFNSEKARISQMSRAEMIAALRDDKGFLRHLRQSRTPDGENLQVILNEIVHEQYFTPHSKNDTIAYAAVSSMNYGVITYISMLRYLIRANIFLADHYLRECEIENFNSQVGQMIADFKSFRDTLNGKSGLIDQVIKIMKEVSNWKLTMGNSNIDFSGWSKNLEREKVNLIHTKLPIIDSVPDKLMAQFKFDRSSPPTPLGSWEDGAKVSYAVQYRSADGLYSKVGEWSVPFTVKRKANPLLMVPAQSSYTRLIFRKFDNEKPQFVGTLKRDSQTVFRDIDRDLYNAASGFDESVAMEEATKLINSGASISATFELSRSAIHAAAMNGNTLLARTLLINDTSSFNTKDVNDYTPLHVAAECGWPEFVNLILDHDFDINAKTKAGSTALHLAVAKGHSAVVEALLNTAHSADLNAQDNSGAGPLHIAVRNDAKHILKNLLDDERTDINLHSVGNLTPLHLSSIMGFRETITEKLLQRPDIRINARSVGNLTALHHAAMNRNLPALRLLAGNMETDINAQSVNGWSPLHYAVSTKEKEIVSELLRLGKMRSLKIDAADVGHTTPLHLAAASDQTSVVENLLDSGAQIDLQNKKGHTALYLAALNKNYEVLTILLMRGANKNVQNVFGMSVLHLVSSVGDIRAVQNILAMGGSIDMNIPNNDGLTAVHLAALNGHEDVFRILLQKGANTNARMANGSTILHLMVAKGDLGAVQIILEDGQNVKIDATNDEGLTALHTAAVNKHHDVMRFLLQKGADASARMSNGSTVLHLMAEKGDLTAVKAILQEGQSVEIDLTNREGLTALHIAAVNKQLDVMRILQQKGADINSRMSDGSTFLHLMAAKGDLSAVKTILEKGRGVEIDLPNKGGLTALHLATIYGHRDVMGILLDKGANINAKTRDRSTALHLSAAKGDLETVKFIINRGNANMRVLNSHMETPMSLAKRRGHTEVADLLKEKIGEVTTSLLKAAKDGNLDEVKLLVRKGADLEVRDDGGSTPLSWAAVRGHLNVVKYLAEEGGVQLNTMSNYNETPLVFAAWAGRFDVVKYLGDRGADLNTKDQSGNTALMWAIRKSHTDIADYLRSKGVTTSLGTENQGEERSRGDGSSVWDDWGYLEDD